MGKFLRTIVYAIGIALLAWPPTYAIGAEEVIISDCPSALATLINGFKRPRVFRIPLTSGKAPELLPDKIPMHIKDSWLGRTLFDAHGWFDFLGRKIPVGTSPLTKASDLDRIFTPGRWYNFNIEGNTITATATGNSFGKDAISKHIDLMSDRKGNSNFSGSFYLDGHGRLYITNGSGTFPTGPEILPKVKALFEAEFAGVQVTTIPHLTVEQFKARLWDKSANEYDGFFNYPDYRQKEGGIFDIEGDLHLIRRWENYFKKMEVSKEKEHYEKRNKERHDAQDPAKNGETIGSKPSILVSRLINSVHQMVQEFPQFEPHFGPAPEWSPAAYAYIKSRIGPLPVPSKVLVAMMPGAVSRFCATGFEGKLEAYVLSRPDGSVQPHEFFREAYRLAEGDITRALMMAENVLAKDAESPDRDKSPTLKKLAYIRNDSAPVFDNYGQWYHMFGMALFTIRNPHPVATVVAEVEILGSRATSFRDRQEELSNRAGVAFGQGLKQLVATGRYKQKLPEGARTDYLNLTEFPLR